MLINAASDRPDAIAYVQRSNGEWKETTFAQARSRVERIGAGLHSLGAGTESRVSILSASRMEWSLADFAILGAGATVVPIYQTNSPEECQYVLADSDSSIVFVENAEQLEKIREQRHALPLLKHVIVFDDTDTKLNTSDGELSLYDLEANASDSDLSWWRKQSDEVTPEALATIIYTSGTTGPPKGCMLTHHNYVYMTEQAAQETVGLFDEGDRVVLFLPLAHTFARLTHFCTVRAGLELAFTNITTLMDDLAELKPTLMPSVPRVFEKAYTRVLSQFNEAIGVKRKLIDRAMKVGALRGRYIQHGRRVPPVLAMQYSFFHKLVFSKIHARFGGNMRLFISGGAPLSREVAEFFLACGIVIVEGYGLTESTTALCVNRPNNFRLGSVGQLFDGTKAKIASDGEILVKGDIVFQGYYRNESATKEVLDADGWLHTGDIGEFDREGFLYITDRKKDIIVTAGGKNIAPANIENALKATQYISQALVYGDKKPYITALITLDQEEILAFAKQHDLPSDLYQLVGTKEVQDLVKTAVEKVNSEVGRVEQLKRMRILPIDFSQETGELTPSLKLKRKVAIERYSEWIEEMYEPDAAAILGVSDPRIGTLQHTPVGV